MPSVTTNDGVKLAYEQSGTSGPAVVLVHGWGASRVSFTLNAGALAERCVVYRYDQRFHGESDKPAWGLSVARLAQQRSSSSSTVRPAPHCGPVSDPLPPVHLLSIGRLLVRKLPPL